MYCAFLSWETVWPLQVALLSLLHSAEDASLIGMGTDWGGPSEHAALLSHKAQHWICASCAGHTSGWIFFAFLVDSAWFFSYFEESTLWWIQLHAPTPCTLHVVSLSVDLFPAPQGPGYFHAPCNCFLWHTFLKSKIQTGFPVPPKTSVKFRFSWPCLMGVTENKRFKEINKCQKCCWEKIVGIENSLKFPNLKKRPLLLNHPVLPPWGVY